MRHEEHGKGSHEQEGNCKEAEHRDLTVDLVGMATRRDWKCESHGHWRGQNPCAVWLVVPWNSLNCGHLGHSGMHHGRPSSNTKEMVGPARASAAKSGHWGKQDKKGCVRVSQTQWDTAIDTLVQLEGYRVEDCTKDTQEVDEGGQPAGAEDRDDSPQGPLANGHLLAAWDSGHWEKACTQAAADNNARLMHDRDGLDLVHLKGKTTSHHDGRLGLHCTHAADYKTGTVLKPQQKKPEVEEVARKDSWPSLLSN